MTQTRTRQVVRPAIAPGESRCLRGFLAEGMFCGAVWEMEKLERS
jgi:hypothetical protein